MPPDRKRLKLMVVGAGPVGLLFARRLIRQQGARGFDIRVVDAQSPLNWEVQRIDPRVYALSRESQWLFGDLWPAIAARRLSPYRRMCVWEGDNPSGDSSISFDSADVGEPDLGHIVEDSLLRSVLLDDLARSDVEIRFDVGVEALDYDYGNGSGSGNGRGPVTVTMSDGTSATADLVVGADGANSKVRSAVGIKSINKNYAQRAVVTHVTSERPHAETAWQRFLPDGPLAFLPLADGRSSIVWTNSEAAAEVLLAANEDKFLRELESASGGILGALGPCTERLSFPLRFAHATRYSRPGVALIGDSAHAVHPLAGQGMNLGLRDAAVLADTLVAALAAGEYPADDLVLRRYARAQKAHNLSMQLAFDGLNELFSGRTPDWAASIRGLGLGLVNRLGPAKRLLMRRALGVDHALGGTASDHAT